MISLILYPGALDIRQNLPFSLNLPTDTILSFSINTFQSQTVPFPLPHSLLFSLPNESPQSPLYLYSHLETKDFSSSTCTRISNGRGLWNEQYTFGGSFTTQFLKNGEIMLELFFDLTIIEHDITLSRKTRSPISNLLVPLIIGHRGLGMNRKLVDEKARLQLGENTYQSFETACDLGAEMVEFDIQMTSDGVPVIYHDFKMATNGIFVDVTRFTFKEFIEARDKFNPALGPLFANTLSKKELIDLNYDRDIGMKRNLLHRSRSSDFAKLEQNDHWPQKSNHDGSIQGPFASFQEIFSLPLNLGFNVEIKYPNKLEAEQNKLLFPELNTFIDGIIKVVNEFSNGRRIIYSSFHPDAIIATRLKQTTHEVHFLTDARPGTPDKRSDSIERAFDFAIEWDLDGVVFNIDAILNDCAAIVGRFHSRGIKVSTYGAKNNIVDFCKFQRDCGVDAIITDELLLIKRSL